MRTASIPPPAELPAEPARPFRGRWRRAAAALADAVRRVPALRSALAAAAGVLVWKFSSTVAQDVLVYGAFLYALTRAGRGSAAWNQPAGWAFAAAALYLLAGLPFSQDPALSWREGRSLLEIMAGAFAIPVLFPTRARLEAALFYSAAALAGVLGYDLIRLAVELGAELPARAHSFQPFILNHSNVASMMAGAMALVFFYFGWTGRRRPWRAAGCAAGAVLGVAYLGLLGSRGPQLAFALTLAATGLLLIPRWPGKLLWAAAAAAAAVLLAAHIEHINPRFAERSSMATFSSRDTVWKHTWALARQRPWFGYGYGKRLFEKTYYSSQPPPSPFHYPHQHQFWLNRLFESGWIGLLLHAAAWALLAAGLLRFTLAQPTFSGRLLPGAVGLILLFIHLYGLGDYPDHVVRMAQYWLVPVALVLMRNPPP